jgi:hypothetical protein
MFRVSANAAVIARATQTVIVKSWLVVSNPQNNAPQNTRVSLSGCFGRLGNSSAWCLELGKLLPTPSVR